MIAYTRDRFCYHAIRPKEIKLPKGVIFNHPKDTKIIIAYLLSTGDLYCDYMTVERLYYDFSHEKGLVWAPAISFRFRMKKHMSDGILDDFADWMDERVVDDEVRCLDSGSTCTCCDISTDIIGSGVESISIMHLIEKSWKDKDQTESLEIVTTGKNGSENYFFEIVDKIPNGYEVWNTGHFIGTDDYIPLIPKDHMDSNTPLRLQAKAIRLQKEEVVLLRKVAGYGITDLRSARMGSPKGIELEGPQRDMVIKIFERISE